MKILSRDKLIKFNKKHSNTKGALDAWFNEAKRAEWKTPRDLKDRYSSTDILTDNRVIFNIKGNHIRLVVKVCYQYRIVVIEWVGTHAEYDKKNF